VGIGGVRAATAAINPLLPDPRRRWSSCAEEEPGRGGRSDGRYRCAAQAVRAGRRTRQKNRK
jgi:hypothetical protein